MTKRTSKGSFRRSWGPGLVLAWLALHFLPSTSIREPYVIAHRGAAGLAPENTTAAVRAAVELGTEYTEVDVQRTADGVLVVMHDSTVNRTTDGRGSVSEMTYTELDSLSIDGEPIPTLYDIQAEVAGTATGLIIEVKKPARFPGIHFDLADLLNDASREYMVSPTIVSFDHRWLGEMQAAYPEITTGQIWLWVPPGGPRLAGARTISVHWLGVLIDPTLVWRLHKRGYEVVAWTVDGPWLMRWLVRCGVDGIATNRPDRWPF